MDTNKSGNSQASGGLNEEVLSSGALDPENAPTKNEIILKGLIQSMSDGVIVLGLNGQVKYINPAVTAILDVQPEDLINRNLAAVFYRYDENDLFNQTVLNALYDPEQKHYELVPYFTGKEFRQLHVMTSILWVDDVKSGIIMIISDITEISTLKIRYAQQVTELLDSLVKTLSTAIDERSHYTANHTRNMVKLGVAFIDWLNTTGAPMHFDDNRKHAFLMSVWLHDVGKLTIPLEIMDKATRLGNNMGLIEQRLDRIHLLDRIALAENRLDAGSFKEREEQRDDLLAIIRRINTCGFLGDEDLQHVQEIAQLSYQEEDGTEHPVMTDEEVHCLQIRKGTLTDTERAIMQSHAELTKKFLEHVVFPDSFADVPKWASAHHELLNGKGYPDHLQGDEIPDEVRLLTILDIFEALTAKDRPYKQPIPIERAFRILHSMVEEGCLDANILELFEKSRAWEKVL